MVTLNPDIKIIAPVREWDMDRNNEIKYAQKHGIPVPASLDFPYSVDDNMWGMTWEGGEVEDRLIGLKDRGVYELPAGHVIITAHKALEQYVSTRELNELKNQLDVKWAYLCYGAKWFDPVMGAINSFNDWVNQRVSGMVTMKLYKGKAEMVAMKSPDALGHVSFSTGGVKFNVNASPGFIEIYTQQMKLWNQGAK